MDVPIPTQSNHLKLQPSMRSKARGSIGIVILIVSNCLLDRVFLSLCLLSGVPGSAFIWETMARNVSFAKSCMGAQQVLEVRLDRFGKRKQHFELALESSSL